MNKSAKISNVFIFETVKEMKFYSSYLRLSLLTISLIAVLSVFAQNHPNGKSTRYYADGQLMEKGKYAENVKVGQWLYYNENGTFLRKEGWKKGKLQWQINYKNGKISETIDKDGIVKKRPNCGC